MNKKTFGIIGAILFILIMISFVWSYKSIIQPFVITDDSVVVADWGHLECTESGEVNEEYEYVGSNNDKMDVVCGDEFTVESCDVSIEFHAKVLTPIQCNVEHCSEYDSSASCVKAGNYYTESTSPNLQVDLPNLRSGEKYVFSCWEFGLAPKIEKGDVIVHSDFMTYHLEAEQDGSMIRVINDNCFVPTKEFSQIPDGQLPASRFVKISEKINYVSRFLLADQQSLYEYEGQDVVCSGGYLYKVDELEMSDGSTKKVQDTSLWKSVACCPYIPGCGDDFKWMSGDLFEEGASCDRPLNQGYVKVGDGTEVAKFDCQDGVVVKTDTKKNNCIGCDGYCTADFECIGGSGGGKPNYEDDEQGWEKYLPLIILAVLIVITIAFLKRKPFVRGR